MAATGTLRTEQPQEEAHMALVAFQITERWGISGPQYVGVYMIDPEDADAGIQTLVGMGMRTGVEDAIRLIIAGNKAMSFNRGGVLINMQVLENGARHSLLQLYHADSLESLRHTRQIGRRYTTLTGRGPVQLVYPDNWAEEIQAVVQDYARGPFRDPRLSIVIGKHWRPQTWMWPYNQWDKWEQDAYTNWSPHERQELKHWTVAPLQADDQYTVLHDLHETTVSSGQIAAQVGKAFETLYREEPDEAWLEARVGRMLFEIRAKM